MYQSIIMVISVASESTLSRSLSQVGGGRRNGFPGNFSLTELSAGWHYRLQCLAVCLSFCLFSTSVCLFNIYFNVFASAITTLTNLSIWIHPMGYFADDTCNQNTHLYPNRIQYVTQWSHCLCTCCHTQCLFVAATIWRRSCSVTTWFVLCSGWQVGWTEDQHTCCTLGTTSECSTDIRELLVDCIDSDRSARPVPIDSNL